MATDPCQPIRDEIKKLEDDIAAIEAVLPELRGPAKKKLEAVLKRLKERLRATQRELAACEKKHRPA